MDRYNSWTKYEQRAKTIAGAYVIAGVSIVVFPFLSTPVANISGYESPYTYAFAALAAIGLGWFAWRYFKNDALRYKKDSDLQIFEFKYPIILAAISLVIFLTAGSFFVNAYVSSGKQGSLSVAICGHPTKLAFWWGPFVYCTSLAVAAYFTYELNEIIKNIKKGLL